MTNNRGNTAPTPFENSKDDYLSFFSFQEKSVPPEESFQASFQIYSAIDYSIPVYSSSSTKAITK